MKVNVEVEYAITVNAVVTIEAESEDAAVVRVREIAEAYAASGATDDGESRRLMDDLVTETHESLRDMRVDGPNDGVLQSVHVWEEEPIATDDEE